MKKISIDDLPFEGAELTEAELSDVSGGLPPVEQDPKMVVSWYVNGKPAEWWIK